MATGAATNLHNVGQAALRCYVAVRDRRRQQRLTRRVHRRLRVRQLLQDCERHLRLLKGAQRSCTLVTESLAHGVFRHFKTIQALLHTGLIVCLVEGSFLRSCR